MDLKKIRKTTKELELEIIGENETVLNPIIQMLLQDKDVDYATYITDHPESNKRRLYIRVKKGKPEEALGKVMKYLEKEMKDFSKHFEGEKSTSKK
jgi:DNA-directed RNA polymerase subunit L